MCVCVYFCALHDWLHLNSSVQYAHLNEGVQCACTIVCVHALIMSVNELRMMDLISA